jgi:hypothetical protein
MKNDIYVYISMENILIFEAYLQISRDFVKASLSRAITRHSSLINPDVVRRNPV